jgi:hypothetical protein
VPHGTARNDSLPQAEKAPWRFEGIAAGLFLRMCRPMIDLIECRLRVRFRRESRRRFAGLTCLLLAACSPPPTPTAPTPSESSTAPAHSAPPSASSMPPASPGEERPKGVDAARVVFGPRDTQIVTPDGTFGNCERKRNPTGVFSVFCDKLGGDQEGLIFNFYLRGVWRNEPFTAEDVAQEMRAQLRPDTTFVGGFAAPDSRTRALHYFLTMSATYPDAQSGQGFVTKVAPLGDGVYSLLYTRMFRGPPELMPEMIRSWLVEMSNQKEMPVTVIEAGEDWLDVVRGGR